MGIAYFDTALSRLIADPIGGYQASGPPATEPTALAAVALLASGHTDAATIAAEWLLRMQAHRGSLGIFPDQGAPCWPTGWAILAWSLWQRETGRTDFHDPLQRAVDWMISVEGRKVGRRPEVGHDGTLVGWPWVEGTHSWVEPTAISLLALQSSGYGGHPRAAQAIQLLLDRQLDQGGCNYGNTRTLGQETLPHAQPTALALLALRREAGDPRVQKSLRYLSGEWPDLQGTSSLCYSAMALTAHDHPPADIEVRLRRLIGPPGTEPSHYACSVLTLALLGDRNPLTAL